MSKAKLRNRFRNNGHLRPGTKREIAAFVRKTVVSDDFARRVAYRTMVEPDVIESVRIAAAKAVRDPRVDPKGYILEVALRSGLTPDVIEHIQQATIFCMNEEIRGRFSVDWSQVEL
jgi:hypothetical protein